MTSVTIFAVLLSVASGFHYAASRRLFLPVCSTA